MERTASALAACTLANLIAGPNSRWTCPYLGGQGDPLGLTSSWNPALLIESVCRPYTPSPHFEVPYTNGGGDPLGLTSSNRGDDVLVSQADFCARANASEIPHGT